MRSIEAGISRLGCGRRVAVTTTASSGGLSCASADDTASAARPPPSAFFIVRTILRLVRAGEVLDLSSVALGRTALERTGRLGAPAPQVIASLACRAARLGFLVELSCLLGRPALVGKRGDHDLPFELANADRERILDLQIVLGLDPYLIQLHSPCRDRLLRQAARLEEARRPEPLINAQRGLRSDR